jgi:hypothetical protein
MKLPILSTTVAFTIARAQGSLDGWTPAGPNDRKIRKFVLLPDPTS